MLLLYTGLQKIQVPTHTFLEKKYTAKQSQMQRTFNKKTATTDNRITANREQVLLNLSLEFE